MVRKVRRCCFGKGERYSAVITDAALRLTMGREMKSSIRQLVLAAIMTFAAAGLGGLSLAQDKEAVIKNREALMKGQGKDLGSVKAYIEGKGELTQAEAGALGLTQSSNKIAEVFPPGTGGTSTNGKYATKPVIW